MGEDTDSKIPTCLPERPQLLRSRGRILMEIGLTPSANGERSNLRHRVIVRIKCHSSVQGSPPWACKLLRTWEVLLTLCAGFGRRCAVSSDSFSQYWGALLYTGQPQTGPVREEGLQLDKKTSRTTETREQRTLLCLALTGKRHSDHEDCLRGEKITWEKAACFNFTFTN